MSTTDTPDDTAELAQAEAELEQAKADVGVVEDKLLDGDPSVATADLIAAEVLVREKMSLRDRLAQIQAGRAARAAEKARKARAAELVDTVTGFGGSTESQVPEAFAKVVAAASEFAQLVGTYNAGLTDLLLEFRKVEPIDDLLVTVPPSGYRLDLRVKGPDGPANLPVDQYNAAELLAEAVALGVAQVGGKHSDAHGLRQAQADSLPEDVGLTVTVNDTTYYSILERRARNRARLIATTGTTEKD